MVGQAITTSYETVTELGSINASLAYLNQQAWWPAFRQSRCNSVRVIDDALIDFLAAACVGPGSSTSF